MIVSGYGVTRPFVSQLSPLWFLIRGIHTLLCLLFTAQFVFHVVVVEFVISSKWFLLFRKSWRKQFKSFIFWKILQKGTGYMIFILSLLVILTGFNFYIPLIGPFFPLFQHRRLDIYLIAILIIHVALGARKVFIRKRMSNGLTNIGIIIVSIAAMSFVFYLDMMR
jgi:hypothetical protein